jgi:hypothetical protein
MSTLDERADQVQEFAERNEVRASIIKIVNARVMMAIVKKYRTDALVYIGVNVVSHAIILIALLTMVANRHSDFQVLFLLPVVIAMFSVVLTVTGILAGLIIGAVLGLHEVFIAPQ